MFLQWDSCKFKDQNVKVEMKTEIKREKKASGEIEKVNYVSTE